ncbi:hypothetical protein [Tomitella gaofuii]|uniref:hypothetical protein n=1 Tax=Tomitella gaofuii TaxID=2760083 RepID=UPI0015FD2D7D|nr:hypothetical protein [Tomitella gaofuii]
MKHTGLWQEEIDADRTLRLIAPTGHRYESAAFGVLDVLSIDADEVADGAHASARGRTDEAAGTADTPGADGRKPRRRRTRAENRAAAVRRERRACRAKRTGGVGSGRTESVDPWQPSPSENCSDAPF